MGVRIVSFTERDFTRQVIDFARLKRWRVAHFRPGTDRRGRWQTAVQGDGVGFPDLILVRGKRMLAVELKVGRGLTTMDQDLWLQAFRDVPGVEAYIWRPDEWDSIVRLLA